MARDLFSAPDPFEVLAFAQPRTVAHMIAAYSREFLLTGPNVQFLRHMLERDSLDEMALRTMGSSD